MQLKIPHHVTGFWLPHYGGSPLETGSLGAGLLLDYAEVYLSGVGIRYNDKLLEAGVGVDIKSPYPLGYGYAGSAVVNIAKHIATLGLSLEAFQRAHIAEVESGTGLGDVLAIYTGGCLVVRTSPGAPGVGKAYGYDCPRLFAVTVDLRRVETAAMLRNLRWQLEIEGRRAVEAMADGDFQTFLELARRFSQAVGFLTPRLEEELRRLAGVFGFYVKKGVLVVVAERDYITDVADVVKKYGAVHVTELKWRAIYSN
ncbi:hypothetical protein [Pyrobaculum neutrophilum]|uniref:Pantoate kinase n=1 Tax=Pyrobaculum neutrophilum (strain DSM 2338 / JCM 9278 / NBRC 100436 / V24Sta) TaxID=444157 RepID=B1YBD2_PYRNV|nr:hypothetical protein [Pyrobaculum neutrophilum]ACB39263.1 conserved hypothetical protein [Pyrobaculum neutrophilum V24Sta]